MGATEPTDPTTHCQVSPHAGVRAGGHGWRGRPGQCARAEGAADASALMSMHAEKKGCKLRWHFKGNEPFCLLQQTLREQLIVGPILNVK